jgi:protein-tyrosine phosphatase
VQRTPRTVDTHVKMFRFLSGRAPWCSVRPSSNLEPGAPSSPPSWRLVVRIAAAIVATVMTFIVLGNLAIVAAWQLTAHATPLEVPQVEGVDNLTAVDDRLWRSAAPEPTAYDDLAAEGVRTVVDLRAGDRTPVDEARLEGLGLDLVHIPVRDGQVPSRAEVEQFLQVIEDSPGRVLVHCGAGVGRTGAMAAAYRGETGMGGGAEAVRQNLAVGPPSLEQLVFASSVDSGPDRPPAGVVAMSRLLDAPRRLWSRFGL